MGTEIVNKLRAKIEQNYQTCRARWLTMTPAQLLDAVEEIEAATRMARDLPSHRISEEQAACLLRFKNPLEVMRDLWISRNGMDVLIVDDELDQMLFSIVDEGWADGCYATEECEMEGPSEAEEREENELLAAEDAVQTTIYLANAPSCCSGIHQLGNVLGMLGADVMDEDVYHNNDDHPALTM